MKVKAPRHTAASSSHSTGTARDNRETTVHPVLDATKHKSAGFSRQAENPTVRRSNGDPSAIMRTSEGKWPSLHSRRFVIRTFSSPGLGLTIRFAKEI